MKKVALIVSLIAAAAWSPAIVHAEALGTGFTYQGRLEQNGTPVDGTVWQMVFTLYNAEVGGSPVGQPVVLDDVAVSNGLFTVTLDFGAEAFNGDNRWLEIQVERNEGDGLTPLNPRQPVTPTPYALQTRGIFVNEAGDRVGIGTTSPKRSLHNTGDYYGRGHLVLHAFEGDGASGIAYLQARDDSQESSIAMRLRTQENGVLREAVHITPSGNVGIGTTNPSPFFALTLSGEQPGIRVQSANDTRPAAIRLSSGFGGEWDIFSPGNSDDLVIDDTAGGNQVMHFSRFSGNIGIGTATPEADLHVVGETALSTARFDSGHAAGTWLRLRNTSEGGREWGVIATGSDNGEGAGGLLIRDNDLGAVRMMIDTDGHLGVGTIDPQTALHVKGTGTFRGNHVAYFESDGASADGVAIQLGNAHTNSGNNFLTFYNSSGVVTGRVEGFDLENGDWVSLPPIPDVGFEVDFDPGDFPTLCCSRLPSLDIDFGFPPSYDFDPGAFPRLSGGRLPSVSGFAFDLPTQQEIEDLICWGLSNGVDGFMQTDPVAIAIEALKVAATKRCLDEGVVYGSKGADYAEWLPKLNPDDDIRFAQIIGVRGGKVSLDTQDAEQIMATSRAPVVVGNIPPEGEADSYVKVGFMGQVPVVVRGHVDPGDYIVPSGYEDGTGVAVSPDEIRIEHLGRILGRAWSASENDIFSLVDVVIGVSTNEAKQIFSVQQERIDALAAENAALRESLDILSADVAELKAALRVNSDATGVVGRR